MPYSLELKISNILHQCTFKQLTQIHAFILTTNLIQNITISSKFLRRSTEFGSMEYSNLIFPQMGGVFATEIILWNAMIRGYAFNGPIDKCLLLLDEMPQRGLKPDNYTYPYVLKSCVEMGLFCKCQKVHCQIVKSGFESGFAVSSSLFDMYVKMAASTGSGCVGSGRRLNDARKVFDDMCAKPIELWNRMISEYINIGDVDCARRLFQCMPERDVVSWNSMISGYARVGDASNAKYLFERMPEKNVVSWTSMIGVYANLGDLETARTFFEKTPCRNVVSWNSMISNYTKNGKFEEALDLFLQMHSEGVVPDGFTFVSVLSACSYSNALGFGKWVHGLIQDWSKLGVIVGTALIEMYAKCGEVDIASTIFIKIRNKDVFCWNVMIKSLAIHGRTEDTIKIFYSMQKLGLKPNDYTFSSALFACSHGGLVEQGRKIFYSMDREFGVSPKIQHFGCLIDLLCRNGQVEEAYWIAKNMPFEPDIVIWGALLGGCRVRSDFKLAEEVIKQADELRANESGVYTLLSNMYASVDQWTDALHAREKMEENKIWKIAGYSSVVYDSKVSQSKLH